MDPLALTRAQADAETVQLDSLDVSRPERFASNTHWPYFARLRRDAPVHFCRQSAYGPYWSITRLDDIQAVEADYKRFSSDGNVIIGDVPSAFDETRAFATSDPPVHTRERNAVAPGLSARRVAAFEEDTRRQVATLLDDLPQDASFNWVERVSIALTTHMVATLFDFPQDERRLLPYWSEVLVTTPGEGQIVRTWEERLAVLAEYRARILEMWRVRAADRPGDDIISLLSHSPETSSMADDPSHLLGLVTLVAGANEAARGALSGCVVGFNQFPDAWEAMKTDPSLVPNGAAEIIRWQSPIAHMRRTAAADVEFRGHLIRKGERVVMWYCSGNRDETYFEDADRLQPARANARRHVAFGSGIHRCLGLHVASMQLRVLLEEMLQRFSRVELVAEPTRTLSNFSAGFTEVLVRVARR
jgi:cytochrome P450